MPGPVITASNATGGALDARVRAEFEVTLEVRKREQDPALEAAWLEVKSDKDQEIYHVWESVPVPVIHRRGDGISRDSFGERSATVVNYAWARGLQWWIDDANDDQTQRMVSRAKSLAERFLELKWRIMVQILTAATDDDLLPAQPNAYDGSALFLGTSRFGHASGNVLTGSGATVVADIQTDYWAGLTRLFAFQDTEGRPYWRPSDLTGDHILIVHPSSRSQQFEEAFEQEIIHRDILAVGAAVSNLLRLPRRKPRLYPTPEITTDDWFILVVGHEPRPLVYQPREPLQDKPWDPSNDREARDKWMSGIDWRERSGYGPFEPRCAIHVNN